MSYLSIKVIAYSGHRGNERPTTLLINDETVTIVGILAKWIEEGFSDRGRKRFFIVKANKWGIWGQAFGYAFSLIFTSAIPSSPSLVSYDKTVAGV
jgi:hypothetical protein